MFCITGLVLVFMGVAAMNPAVQDELIRVVGESFMTGPLAVVGEAYVNPKCSMQLA
jgi:hypothetical protein